MTKEDFRRWRHRLDMSQEEAGKRLGLTSRQIGAYERGEQKIPEAIVLATIELERRSNAA